MNNTDTVAAETKGTSSAKRPKRPMLRMILLALAVLIIGFVIVVAMQPEDYQVSRSATISAPAAVVFAQVNDFHKWEAWSPWLKKDPAAKGTYEGPSAGTGAVFGWDGNAEVGSGKMTITDSKLDERLAFRLEFFKPTSGTADAEFAFQPQGNQTNVTWTISGKKNFISKAFCMFMSMDKMIGGDFEQGLAGIKQIAEAAAR